MQHNTILAWLYMRPPAAERTPLPRQNQVRTMDDSELKAELRNSFPSPPSHYRHHIPQNLGLLVLPKSSTDGAGDTESETGRREVFADEPDIPDRDLRTLEPPRVYWVLEDGHYSVFGDT